MSDLYRECEHAIDNTFCDVTCDAYVRGDGYVKVEATDRICIVHGTSGKIALAVLSDECHDHLHGGQNCKMVDVVRLET